MAQEFKLDVFCEHGNLSADEPTRKAIPKQVRFTKKGMEILKARFPELETIEEGQDPCSVCIVANFTRAELEKVTKSELQMENAILGRLTRITRLEAVVDDRFFAIPTIFVEKIRAAILDPQENCRPTVIDTRVLMCNNHQMLKYSPEYDNIKNAHYWAAVESDWEYLNRNYERIGPEIVLESRNIDDTIIMYPVLGWCEACRIEMISNYSSGTVLVVQRPLDDGKGMPSKPDKKRSARKVSRKSASRLEVEIAPTMTLRELMYKLVPKFKAHPLYQKIYKNKIELDTMDATLKELTIYPGDRLEVEIYAQDSQDFADEEPFHSVEAGFKGTFLHDVA